MKTTHLSEERFLPKLRGLLKDLNPGTYGLWAFGEFTEIYQIKMDLEVKVEAELNKMTE